MPDHCFGRCDGHHEMVGFRKDACVKRSEAAAGCVLVCRRPRRAAATGDNIVEHVAGVDDFEVAEATYRGSSSALTVGADHAAAAEEKPERSQQ